MMNAVCGFVVRKTVAVGCLLKLTGFASVKEGEN